MSNAVKFSPQGEVVRVSALSRSGTWRLSVSDNGPGIPEAFRTRMFEKFSQADSSETRRAGGTGLGLHITREIVQRMHGQIGFDTELGKGTVFWIEFPQLPSKTTEQASTSTPRILHVEDDPDFAEMLRETLHGQAETIVAATFFEAERMLATAPFDLIVLDVSLPDRSGLELLDRLQSRGDRRPPVVLLCAAQPPTEFRARVAAVIVKSRMPEQKIAETIVGLIKRNESLPAQG